MRTKLASLLLIVILIITMTTIPVVWSAEDTGKISLELLSSPAVVGDTVTLQVSVKEISSKTFYASDVGIYYNPTVLKCTSKPVMGQALQNSGVMVKVYEKIEDQKGLARYTIGMDPNKRLEEGWSVPSGEVILFTLEFEVVGQGDMDLQIAAKETSPFYEDTFPAGAKMFLGNPNELATLQYETLSYVIGEKGDALITNILPIDPITVPYGTENVQTLLPKKVSVQLDDGSIKEMGITWTGFLSSFDPTVAGKYLFRGELQEEEGYKNQQGLYSMLEVTMLPEPSQQPDPGTEQPEQPEQPNPDPGTEEPEQPEQPNPDPETEDPKPAVTFNDLDSVPWALEKITSLAQAGVISGVSADSFAPNSPVTRAQFAAMLTRAFGLLDETAEGDFLDVVQGEWYYSAVASAKKAGITAGYEDQTFRPHALITRQEMATMAYRTAGIAGIDLSQSIEKINFSDQELIASYALESISSMQQAGIINGMGDGSFGPMENATRAQAAVIIYQLYQLK